jgi:hypothetical protein
MVKSAVRRDSMKTLEIKRIERALLWHSLGNCLCHDGFHPVYSIAISGTVNGKTYNGARYFDSQFFKAVQAMARYG